MKRKLVVYLAGLLTVLSVGFGSAQFSDVPAGHWAREAVERIAQKGLITGFPDGTFRGNQNLTRYQAALIIDRLLQQLQQPAAPGTPGPSEEDMAAIRNAVQELAAELAALGVRVSALEDNSATKDDVAALQAAIDELKGMQGAAPAEPDTSMQDAMDNLQQQLQEQIDSLQAQIDELKAGGESMEPAAPTEAAPADTSDTQGQIDSLQEQIDTLQQQIDELSAKMDEMGSMAAPAEPGVDPAAVAELSDRVEAASVAADTALAQAEQLAERLGQAEARLDAAEGNLAALQTQVEADADSIRALNELAVLLNQDVLSLQDRVTALEKTLADVDFDSFATKEDVSAIQEFATALRGDLVRLSDRVSALDTRVAGIDTRLASVEGTRPTLTGNLTARYGYSTTTGADYDVDRLFPGIIWGAGFTGDGNDNGQIVDDVDLRAADAGNNRARLTTTFGLKRPTVGTGAGFNLSEATVTLRFTQDGAIRFGGAPNAASINETFRLQAVRIVGNIDNQPLTVAYSRDGNQFAFTKYFMSNANDFYAGLGRGFKIDFAASKAIFSPAITVVIGSEADNALAGTADYFGTRVAVQPLSGFSVGLNYGERNIRDVATGRSGFAIDWNGSLFGLINLEGEYVASKSITQTSWDFSNSAIVDQAFYIKPSVTLGPIKLEANYRAVDPQFADSGSGGASNANNAGMSIDYATNSFDKKPYDGDNRGFGVTATLTGLLGFLNVGATYDSNTDFGGSAASLRNKIDVNASASLFAGFSVKVFYVNIAAPNIADTVVNGDSNLGVELTHSGSASNALIRGLDLGFLFKQEDQNTNTDYDRTIIAANATFNGDFGFLKIKPGLRFESWSGSGAGSAFKFGVEASTQPLNLGFIKPDLSGGFVTVSDTRGAPAALANASTETYFRVSVGLADFLLNGAKLNVGFSSFSATNVNTNGTAGGENKAFDYGANFIYDDTAGALGYSLSGLYIDYTYAGLGLYVGNFTLTPTGGVANNGTAFRISYSLNF